MIPLNPIQCIYQELQDLGPSICQAAILRTSSQEGHPQSPPRLEFNSFKCYEVFLQIVSRSLQWLTPSNFTNQNILLKLASPNPRAPVFFTALIAKGKMLFSLPHVSLLLKASTSVSEMGVSAGPWRKWENSEAEKNTMAKKKKNLINHNQDQHCYL